MKAVFLLALVVMLGSCRSSRTNKTISRVTTDSLAQVKVDSGSVVKKNEVSVVKKEEEKTRVTTVDFDKDTSENDFGEDFNGGKYPPKAEDYFSIDTAGTIRIVGKIKRVKVVEHGVSSSKDSNSRVIIDSNFNKKDNSVKVIKNEEKKEVQKKKTGGLFSSLGILVVLGGVAYLIIFIYRKRKKL